MANKLRQIIAIGGGGFYRDSENLALEKYVIQQTGVESPRVCFVPTASGEPDHYLSSFYAAFLKLGCRPSVLTFFKRTPELRTFLLNQDVIYVGGGNTKTLLAVWRDWGVTEILREAWEAGVVLTGVSAGAICWFEQGMTDSFSDELRPLHCLGFLPGSCCPHYDGEPQRRPSYHRLLASGEIAAGLAIEDWTGVHFRGTELHRVIASKPGARAYSMRAVYGSVQEVPLPVEYLG
ncbi:MAG: peptidase E [Deltaproteobacteria bacterium]|nr:peptidase E [Deltaproteobacteria bacterium]MBI2367004.1 peptidase E [Deltaproteobacteria bacterium]MBI3063335.1 peptidase E [Deltaproteobacteria bacterium]